MDDTLEFLRIAIPFVMIFAWGWAIYNQDAKLWFVLWPCYVIAAAVIVPTWVPPATCGKCFEFDWVVVSTMAGIGYPLVSFLALLALVEEPGGEPPAEVQKISVQRAAEIGHGLVEDHPDFAVNGVGRTVHENLMGNGQPVEGTVYVDADSPYPTNSESGMDYVTYLKNNGHRENNRVDVVVRGSHKHEHARQVTVEQVERRWWR